MQSKTYSCRSGTARASPWRVLNALTIAALGALLMFVASAVAHATAPPLGAAVSHRAVIATDLTASLDAPAFSAGAADCDHARRSKPEFRSNGDGSSPFRDPAEEDRDDDDDDDDDLHRIHGAVPSGLNARRSLDQHSCPLLEGVLSDHQTPNEFLIDSVRRM